MVAILAFGQAVNVNVSSNPRWWTYIPAAVSALAAIATFSIAFAVWWRGSNDRVREQASKIYVATGRDPGEDGSLTVTARVVNSSEAPVDRVQVRPRRDGKVYNNSELTQHLPYILPGDSYTWSWSVAPDDVDDENRFPELTFVDSAERHWKRVGLSLQRV
jgi:hypothetical protein